MDIETYSGHTMRISYRVYLSGSGLFSLYVRFMKLYI